MTLDNNFLQDFKSRPLPLQFSLKRLLSIAIHNDSNFFAKHQIIDYSMLVVVDPVAKTIRVGLVDYIQQYTIEKQFESIIKEKISGEEPTIVSPDLYKTRFRAAMDRYFVAMIGDRESSVPILVTNLYGAQ